jgi:hypothetical protein
VSFFTLTDLQALKRTTHLTGDWENFGERVLRHMRSHSIFTAARTTVILLYSTLFFLALAACSSQVEASGLNSKEVSSYIDIDANEGQVLRFGDEFCKYGSQVEIRVIELPPGASMPSASGFDCVHTTFRWDIGFCTNFLDYHYVVVDHWSLGNEGDVKTVVYRIRIHNVNRMPTLILSDAIRCRTSFLEEFVDTIPPGESWQVHFRVDDPDVRECSDDDLLLSSLILPPTYGFDMHDLGNGSGSANLIPAASDSGWYRVKLKAIDHYGDSAVQTWRLLVRQNHAPVFETALASPRTLTVGSQLRIALRARDLDRAQFGDDTLRMSFLATPSIATSNFVDSGDGTASFVWSPQITELGSYDISFVCADRYGIADSVHLKIFVSACGDADGSGSVNLADIVFILAYIFQDGPAPNSPFLADADCNSRILVADVVYIVNYIYLDGPAPCAKCP